MGNVKKMEKKKKTTGGHIFSIVILKFNKK